MPHTAHQVGMKKLEKLEMILKICNFKKREWGLKVKNVCKQVRDQIAWKQLKIQLKGCYRMEINFKAFAIPILTAMLPTIN